MDPQSVFLTVTWEPFYYYTCVTKYGTLFYHWSVYHTSKERSVLGHFNKTAPGLYNKAKLH